MVGSLGDTRPCNNTRENSMNSTETRGDVRKCWSLPPKKHVICPYSSLEFIVSGWFISNFRVFGGSFREVFWKVLTCFSESYRTSFRTNFRTKTPEILLISPLNAFKGPLKGPYAPPRHLPDQPTQMPTPCWRGSEHWTRAAAALPPSPTPGLAVARIRFRFFRFFPFKRCWRIIKDFPGIFP